jgi:alpha-mannosidase
METRGKKFFLLSALMRSKRVKMPMAQDAEKITYIIPHTHWDREWYVPFQIFRFRLVEMIDHLLDVMESNPKFSYFNLDCQTIVLDDYVEIRPENAPRLKKLIQAGKIGIGPWYCQSSPSLQTGEGLIRNLLKGIMACKKWGVKPVDLGYVPDQFIHPAQMPQIYRGFGLTHSAFSRGIGNQYEDVPGLCVEFDWEAPDGSKVTAFHLRAGYGQNAHLGNDPGQALNQMVFNQANLNKLPWTTPIRLCFAGSDHCGVEEVLLEAIDIWNDEEEIVEENGKIKLASWNEYFRDFHALAPQLKTVKGELSGRKYQITLHGVFSSYIHLKRLNFAIHDLLEHWSEPYSVWMEQRGLISMQGFLNESWKWLLQNQPHDSSWTSSVDQVQREMETRFAWAQQIADDVFRRSAQWVVQHLAPAKSKEEVRIVVFNPHPWVRSGLIRARYADKGLESGIILFDSEEKEHTFQLFSVDPSGNDSDRDRRRVFVGSHGPLGRNFQEILFWANDIPALGYKTFFLRKRDPKKDLFETLEEGVLDGNDFFLENEQIRVVLEQDGSITIMEKHPEIAIPEHLTKLSGLADLGNLDGTPEIQFKFPRLQVLEDISDIGDGWEFRPLKGDTDRVLSLKSLKSQLITANDSVGTIRVNYVFQIPEDIAGDRLSRSEKLVDLPVELDLTLHKNDRRLVECHLKIVNTAKHHRLRVVFPTKTNTDHVTIGGHFGVFTRPIALPDGAGWMHPPEAIHPHQKFVSVWNANQKRGFAVVSKGIPIYEAYPAPDGTINLALTLYRSIGEWGNHIGITPPVLTPDGLLMNKELHFDFGMIPMNKPWDQGKEPVYQLAEEFYSPIRWEEDYDTYRFQVDPATKDFPFQDSVLSIEPRIVQLTTLKQTEDGSGDIIVRMVNLDQKQHLVTVKTNLSFSGGFLVDLKEDPLVEQADFKITGNTITFTILGAKIMSIRLKTN